ncbi:NADH-quinone oxidoreductase subunit B family protein [Paraburkholderia caballeronis]|uniref:Ni,Fe-hydrogenase III small subunit n=1 Tax=Paraburkholderia caballeronis TaxID=416943 RepID=A0A1H7LFP6_9BURK|nr:NADH-quinone oxidoreductase subunit B family protein [Paraburkholderia caballeronis]PXW28445.1 Ni,Fe-hydrogenase III small subunit [Paraburkholderia caballeronis]PXX03811.1 Ni,Fe-hydrogenase III small subunit [Paraburkholderia caballeronis]RAK04555.1 Ni,Fe-hydrogenase III small subunit [Paraburkholderia caballeronis]TDV19464.1 Ni,Fe-hydrogenase III small subunit [Paraburkholderia caballeronis]TDV22064.1 Ni,Fe-hydrogenase III small subunit [Paraburkholderia caballeronis]
MWQLLKQIATTGTPDEPAPAPADEWRAEGERIQQEILDVLGRALTIRQIDAGSCNGCELEIHALNNPYYNIEGLGIRFVASPRHADLLLITGPLALNMREAVRQAYDATPAPKLVVAAGECACTGGIFRDGYAVCGGVSDLLPVDVSIPGCPPSPADLLRGILAAVRNQRN